ncbi:MAG: AsmA family protein, partial [Rickettsiales bacterium]
MKRLLKWFFIFVLLLIVALVAAPFFIPLDSVKKIASEKVKEMTGRDLVIAGDVKASMWPNIGVTLQQVTLSNPEGYSDKNMAEIGDITIAVALMPLLHKEVQVKEFIINKPIIHLEINKQGVVNWEFATQQKEESKATSLQENTAPEKPAALPVLGEIKITNGDFTYKDQRTGKTYNASKVDLGVKMEALESPLDIAVLFDYNKQEVYAGLHVENPMKLLQDGDSKIDTDIKIGSLLELGFNGVASKNSAKGDMRFISSSLVDLSGLTGKKMDWKGNTDLAFSIGGILTCSDSVCSLNHAHFGLNSNEFSGDMKINFAGVVPSIEAKLTADKFILDYYLLEAEKQASLSLISEAQAATGGWDAKPIDLSGLKTANVNLALDVKEMLYQTTSLTNVSLLVKLANGALALNIPHVELYGGTAKVSATANASNAISANLDINNVQVEPMLKDFA